MTTAIIVAAGKSERMGENVDKAFFPLGTSSKPVLAHTLRIMEQCHDIDKVVLVVRKDKIHSAQGLVQLFGCKKVSKIVAGGACRQASVAAGLAACDDDTTTVAVHDGVRPCVSPALITETVRSAKTKGTGVAAMKITDTVKSSEKNNIVTDTIDREKLWTVQTPRPSKSPSSAKPLPKPTPTASNTPTNPPPSKPPANPSTSSPPSPTTSKSLSPKTCAPPRCCWEYRVDKRSSLM